MKPLQNQYQDLLEGKISKFNFLTNIKRTLPDLVSNVTSFEDAVKILKSKRILSENIHNTSQMGGVTTSKGTAGYINNPDKKGGDYDPKARAANLAKLANFGPKKSVKEIENETATIGYTSELSVENIRNIIKNTNRFYRAEKTNIDKSSEDEIIRVFMNGDRLTGDTRKILEKLFDVREESEEIDTDRLPLYTYFISPKSTPDQDIPQKDDTSYDDIFENKDKLKEISVNQLVPGHSYEYSGGAEYTTLKYIGTSANNPNIKVGSSMGKGHIFQWPEGKYFELGPISISKYIEKADIEDENITSRYDDEQEKHALPGSNVYYESKKYTKNKVNENVNLPANLITDVDKLNPLEYRAGLDYELDLSGDFTANGLEKAVKKVVKNLKSNPIYYTNLKAEATKKINKKEAQAAKQVEVKKDNHVDKLNSLKTLVKKELSNTKTTLSKQEKASKAMPKGVKLMKEERDVQARYNEYVGKLSHGNKANIEKQWKEAGEDMAKKHKVVVRAKELSRIKEYVVNQLKKEVVNPQDVAAAKAKGEVINVPKEDTQGQEIIKKAKANYSTY